MINPGPEFRPTEVWESDPKLIEYDEAYLLAREELNRQNPGQIIDSLIQKAEISPGGIRFAVLDGDEPEEYSNNGAMVLFSQYAFTMSTNLLTRAELIRVVAKHADVRDEEDGKLLPVIVMASPGMNGSALNLTEDDYLRVLAGELGPVAREYLRVVSERDFGRVALLGYSQGGDLALAGARSGNAANLDTLAVGAADMAQVMARSKSQLRKDFMQYGTKKLKAVVESSGVDLQNIASHYRSDAVKFVINSLYADNDMLYTALTHDMFEQQMRQIIYERSVSRLVVGYGARTAIARPANVEPAMQRLYDEFGSDSFISIRVKDGNHSWGDQLGLLAKIFMKAVA